jgi:electron transport complex protein RnfG
VKNKYAWLILCLITVVAAFALSLTNMVTEGPIAEQKLKASNAARTAVFADADAFAEQPVAEGSKLDSVYAAERGGQTVGYVLQATVSGYGGPIEVVLGVDNAGKITGISVGGSAFAETAGLGTRTREPAFTGQFIGLTAAPELGVNVDAISGATISSTAVTSAAKRCYQYWQTLAGVAAPAVTEAPLTAENVKTVTVRGYASEFTVTVGFSADGTIEGVQIGGDGFAETEGLGARVLEAAFRDQFIGKKAPVSYGDGIDAISGATITSKAVLKGVNEALGVEATEPAAVEPVVTVLDTPDEQGAVKIVTETVQGFKSEIVIKVGLTADGAIASLSIGGPNFDETEYYGAEVQTNQFRNQFIGKSGQLTYGDGVDAVAGATITSNAVLAAINDALTR